MNTIDLTPEELVLVVRALENTAATLIHRANEWDQRGKSRNDAAQNRKDAAAMRALAARWPDVRA